MASDIWLRTILIVRKETRCRHIGYSFRLAAMVLLYAPYHRQDSTYHGFCYTSHGALAGTRNSSMGPPHEGSIRRSIAPRGTKATHDSSGLYQTSSPFGLSLSGRISYLLLLLLLFVCLFVVVVVVDDECTMLQFVPRHME